MFEFKNLIVNASKECTASKRCPHGSFSQPARALLLLALLGGCTDLPEVIAHPASKPAFDIFVAPGSGSSEQSCAWYGDARDGVLYFGESAFWSGLRETGDPLAELDHLGTRRIGRFDLEKRAMLPALVVAEEQESGTWDVLAHPNGRIYYTTFFGDAGWIDPLSERSGRFPHLGKGLNEWARGPNETLLVTRYGDTGFNETQSGSSENTVLWIDPNGSKRAEWPLPSAGESVLAPKTVAWDPVADEIWVSTDLLPERAGPGGHPTVVLGFDGRERARIDDVEVQYARFAEDGTGYFAVSSGRTLKLAVRPPQANGQGLGGAHWITLDTDFHPNLDFAQNLRLSADGRVLVTTWGGRIFSVNPQTTGRVQVFDFPRARKDGLYYSAVSAGRSICATYCAGLSVVCTRTD
ncbi:MAG: hypothetical protein VX574_04365 [Myxococcota bacterium]|nr:hypothetical protein [Myxococcota bacterium]